LIPLLVETCLSEKNSNGFLFLLALVPFTFSSALEAPGINWCSSLVLKQLPISIFLNKNSFQSYFFVNLSILFLWITGTKFSKKNGFSFKAFLLEEIFKTFNKFVLNASLFLSLKKIWFSR
jgi:hypothetical protein